MVFAKHPITALVLFASLLTAPSVCSGAGTPSTTAKPGAQVQSGIPKDFIPKPIMPSERDALDSMMTEDEQWESGAEGLSKEERLALARVLLRVYASGQKQQFIVVSSYGTFTAGLFEFTGSTFVFDIGPTELQRLKRNQPSLEWLPDGRLVLYPHQVTWIRR